MRLARAVALLLTAGRAAEAQRPSDQPICDYYASVRYGENNITTQFRLMQSIVALAFGGGGALNNPPPNSTGIFNQGTFEGQPVNLRSWFDGTRASTNLNNQPVGINWVDAGATEPLNAFLNGSTDTVVLANTTNQYRLLTHWYTAFGFVFGCSLARSFPRTNESGGPISLAYVHKYMNLNQTHLGHFIEQFTASSLYFGISETDAGTLNTFMNARYNVRCAPAVNGQLYSLCQATECPLAWPSADCAAYVNLGPGGNSTGSPATQTPGPTSSATSTSTSSPSSSNTAATETSSSGSQLSTGAIAGIAIGGAAVLLLAVGLVIFARRRSSPPQLVPVPVPSGHGSYGSPPHLSYSPNPHASYPPSNPHDSYLGLSGQGPGIFAPKPPEVAEVNYGTPQQLAVAHSPPLHRIAEMESPQEPLRYSPAQPLDPTLQGPAQPMDPSPSPYSPTHPRDYGHVSLGYGNTTPRPWSQSNRDG